MTTTSSSGVAKAHISWIIGVLLTAIVLLVSIKWSHYPNFIDRLNFAATLASLILAVLAIVYAFYSNDAITGSVKSLSESATLMSSNNVKFEESVKGLHELVSRRFDLVETKFDQLSSSRQAQATQVPPAANVSVEVIGLVRGFLAGSSWNGLKVILACQLANLRSQPVRLRSICSGDARMSFDYAYGYLVASSSVGFFRHTPDPELNAINIPHFPQMLADELSTAIQSRIPQDGPVEEALRRKDIAFIETYFPAPQVQQAPVAASTQPAVQGGPHGVAP